MAIIPLKILTLSEIEHKYRLSKEEKKEFQILLIFVSLMAFLSGISISTFIFTFYPYITGA